MNTQGECPGLGASAPSGREGNGRGVKGMAGMREGIGGYPQMLMADDYDNITYPLTELGWELGEEINPVMYTTQDWEKYRNTPFVRNVEKEGVKIWI